MEIIGIENVRRVKTKPARDIEPGTEFKFVEFGSVYLRAEIPITALGWAVCVRVCDIPLPARVGYVVPLDMVNSKAIPLIDGEPEYEEVMPDGAEGATVRQVKAGKVFQCSDIADTNPLVMHDEGGCVCHDGTLLNVRDHMDKDCIIYHNATLVLAGVKGDADE